MSLWALAQLSGVLGTATQALDPWVKKQIMFCKSCFANQFSLTQPNFFDAVRFIVNVCNKYLPPWSAMSTPHLSRYVPSQISCHSDSDTDHKWPLWALLCQLQQKTKFSGTVYQEMGEILKSAKTNISPWPCFLLIKPDCPIRVLSDHKTNFTNSLLQL